MSQIYFTVLLAFLKHMLDFELKFQTYTNLETIGNGSRYCITAEIRILS